MVAKKGFIILAITQTLAQIAVGLAYSTLPINLFFAIVGNIYIYYTYRKNCIQ